ncbi:putative inactive leucine-rich repeat receptor-like protein kinase [Dorcoceras hygrometricum]|uniref:Putative inactive leucine-rich repeat receptor-like protein kinase n=1 Tax=Dorcoceras hygrometricum TaxID=472368 RepID=A0A2Z7BP66_9LAMI|nr:putative inactive leucine-rich repeat receptor-like protein kinase [Dorcoceras hygrometricum]
MKHLNDNVAVVLNFLCFVTFCFSFTASLNSDGLSLLSLKAAIIEDPTQALVSWSETDSTPCRWLGVTCDRSHDRVTSISLSSKNLTGYIPSVIGALSFLAALDLSNNFFGGPLPLAISNLQTLVLLDLSCNNFNGSLPEGLSNLTKLRGTLNLSYNAFSGYIPASYGLFPVMVSLDLRYNNLTGKIPEVGSLLNQGPTAFSGNSYLCGFPLDTPCSEPEAQNPRFFINPQKPGDGGVSSNGFIENRKIRSGPVLISVISGVSFVVGVVFVSVYVIKRKGKMGEGKMGKENLCDEELGMEKRERKEEEQKGKFVLVDEGLELEIEDLLRASAYVVGKSRSGIVYKVVVGGGGKGGCSQATVAVRRLSEGDQPLKFKEFEAEAEAIGRVEHPNIVKLKAYYYASDEKLLVSEFIRNGSLHNALHGGPAYTSPPLLWAARLKIIRETARGLMHIHECSPRKYVHGNIKSSKILLDDDLKPYISGFGLSRLVPTNSKSSHPQPMTPKSSSSTPSAIMYTAPESRSPNSKLTQKSDVYSFGIVLLEILTGRIPDGWPDDDGKGLESRVRKVFLEERPLSEVIDPALLHEVYAKKQVVATFHVALNCTELDPELRPRMRTVCDNLDSIKLN